MQTILVPEEVLVSFFGQQRHHLELLSTARSGCSGPKVVFLRNGSPRKLALKYGQTRVPILTQFENRRLLSEFMAERLSEIISYCSYSGGEAMLMAAIDGPNLHEAVMLGLVPDQRILEILKSITTDFLRMWVDSRSTEQSFTLFRDPKVRITRVVEAAFTALSDLGIHRDDKIAVNGSEIGTAGHLLSILDSYQPPEFSVFCHSDLNADNFVIPSDGNWYLVDWEWVGRHDWRLCLSHLYGWWSSNSTRLENKPVMSRLGNTVELQYEISSPAICGEIQKYCLEAGELAAQTLNDAANWRKNFNLLVAALLLGDVRFNPGRGRADYTIPLLGEGMKMLAQS